MAPDALSNFSLPIGFAETAVALEPESAQFADTLGAVLCRAGRFGESIQKLEEAGRISPDEGDQRSAAYADFFLAMAEQNLGHAQKAREWLDKANGSMDQELKGLKSTERQRWNRILTLRILRKEAEALIEKEGASPALKK